jgi:prepilin-type N-terminal cleavage/methylation domain-containing protein
MHDRRAKAGATRRRRKGMTLLELAIVVTLTGIMLGVVVPRIASSYSRAQLDAAAHALARDLGRARMEAIRKNQSVTVTRLADTAYRVGTEPVRRLPYTVTFKAGASLAAATFTPLGITSTAQGLFHLRTSAEVRLVYVRKSGLVSVR